MKYVAPGFVFCTLLVVDLLLVLWGDVVWPYVLAFGLSCFALAAVMMAVQRSLEGPPRP